MIVDGAPLEHGAISFAAVEPGGMRDGAVITDGRFEIPDDKGLAPGKYIVRILATEESASPGSGVEHQAEGVVPDSSAG